MYHPKKWFFDEETSEWLPRLSKLRFDAGANNVLENGNITLAVAGAAQNGWQVISAGDDRLGPYQDYLRVMPVDNGRKAYTDRWTTYSIEGGLVFEDFDNDGYREFLRHLVRSGIIGSISPNMRSFHAKRQAKRLQRAEVAHASNPSNGMLKLRVEAERGRYAAMQEAKPKKGKGKGKKYGTRVASVDTVGANDA